MNVEMRRHGAMVVSISMSVLAIGCATPPAAPPPMLSLADKVCADVPELRQARQLSFDRHKDQSLTVVMDDATPCLNVAAGAKSAYAVFGLPAASSPYMVTVGSAPVGEGLFSPHLVLLDAGGKRLREVPRDSFLFRGRDLSVAIRVHAEERFLVVASDPQTVGTSETQIMETTQSSYVSTGTIGFFVNSGAESTRNIIYAHSGKVAVELRSLPQ